MTLVRYLLGLLLLLAAIPAQAAVNYGNGGNPLGVVWNKSQYATLTNNQIAAAVRIPNQLLRTSNGKLLSFAEVRNNATNDANCFAICVRVSSDEGATWGPIVEILTSNTPTSGSTVRMALGAAFELADGRVGLLVSYWTAWLDTPSQAAADGVNLIEVYTTGTDYEVWSDTGDIATTGGTNVTSTTIKTNNTTPITMPDPINTTNDNWVYMVPTSAVTLANGDVIVGCVARYDDVDISYFVTLKRTAAGVWSILGGLDEADGDAQDMNESTMAVVNDGAYILAIMRDRNAGQYHWAKSSDGGVTWGAEITGSPDPIGVSTAGGDVQPDMIVDPDDDSKVYFAGPNETIRCNMTVWNVSVTAGTPTFGTSLQIDEGWSGYPGIECFSGGRIVCVWECTDNYATYANPFQFIRQATLSRDDIGGTPPSLDLHFNELASGSAMLTGPSVISHGMPAPAFGNTAWTYGANYVTNDGSTGIQVDPVRTSSTRGTAFDTHDGSFTIEVTADFSNITAIGATQIIIGNRTSSSSGAGWCIATTSTNRKAIFRVGESDAGQLSTTHDDLLDVGTQPKTLTMVYEQGVGLSGYVDGVLAATSPVADTINSTTMNQLASVIGELPSGASPMSASTEFYRVRFTRAALDPADFITTSSVKASLAKYLSGHELPAFAPTTLYPSNCKFWVGSFADGGARVSGDVACGISPIGSLGGNGVLSLAEYTSNIVFSNVSASLYRNAIIDSDTTVGPSIRVLRKTTDGSTSGWATPTVNTNWEFIQETGRVTIGIGAIRFNHSTGNPQEIVLDNRFSTGTNAGFTVYRDSSNRMNFAFSYSGTPRIDTHSGATTFANGTWYTMWWVADGDASTCAFYWKAWPGNLAPPTSLTGPVSFGTVAGNDGTDATYDADFALQIGGRTGGDNSTGSFSFKDIMIFDDNLSTAQMLELTQNSNYAGGSAASSNGLNLGIGIGLGANDRPHIKVPNTFTLSP